jgi:outer membrane protein
MKKLVLVLITAVLVNYVNAQTSKGNMMVGGALSFYTLSDQSDSDYEYKGTSFSPSFGYFLFDNFAVGAELSVGSNTEDTGNTKRVTSSFGFGPFARYYKFTSNESFAFFGQARFLYSSGKVDDTPGGENKTQAISFSISPGFSYFFTKHWALDLSIAGLTIQSNDPNKDVDDDKVNTIQFGISSLSPTLGFRYHFGN